MGLLQASWPFQKQSITWLKTIEKKTGKNNPDLVDLIFIEQFDLLPFGQRYAAIIYQSYLSLEREITKPIISGFILWSFVNEQSLFMSFKIKSCRWDQVGWYCSGRGKSFSLKTTAFEIAENSPD